MLKSWTSATCGQLGRGARGDEQDPHVDEDENEDEDEDGFEIYFDSCTKKRNRGQLDSWESGI